MRSRRIDHEFGIGLTCHDGSAKAGPLVKKLLDDLKENAPDTVLRLYSPVPNGHIIRFRIVEGDKAPLTKYISSCGLKLDGDSIVAPEDEPVHAEGDPNAPATDGHLHTAYREQNEVRVWSRHAVQAVFDVLCSLLAGRNS